MVMLMTARMTAFLSVLMLVLPAKPRLFHQSPPFNAGYTTQPCMAASKLPQRRRANACLARSCAARKWRQGGCINRVLKVPLNLVGKNDDGVVQAEILWRQGKQCAVPAGKSGDDAGP